MKPFISLGFLLFSFSANAQVEIVADSLTFCSYSLSKLERTQYVFLSQADYEESDFYKKMNGQCLPFEIDFESNILLAFMHSASRCDRRIVESRLSMLREGCLIEFCPVSNVCRDAPQPVVAWFVLPKSVQNSKIMVERKSCNTFNPR